MILAPASLLPALVSQKLKHAFLYLILGNGNNTGDANRPKLNLNKKR